MSIRGRFNAQKLDQRINFERRIETQDGEGDMVVTWVPNGGCYAAVDGQRASEFSVSDGIRSPTGMTFWVRSDTFQRFGVLLTDRIVWGGKHFNISDAPDQQLRGRFIAIFATAGVNEG